MIKPPLAENEERRLYSLHNYNILDTLSEQVYDDITHLAPEDQTKIFALLHHYSPKKNQR
jgi:hypothetical protein